MNKSTSFQSVGGVVLSGKPPRRFPAFLTIWGGQTERQAALLDVKLHAARFRVAVSRAARTGVLLGIGGKPLLQGCVVGADSVGRLVKPPEFGPSLLILKREFYRSLFRISVDG